FFRAEDGIRGFHVTGVQTCALPISRCREAPAKSYWVGCSTGGREGLKAIQQFPEDYDAVVAGAPANNWSPLMSLSILIQRNIGQIGRAACRAWERAAASDRAVCIRT